MRLNSVSVRNFRRLKNVNIDFDDEVTVFVGPNNSGKTSAAAVMRSFLSDREFRIHDFSISEIEKFDAYDFDTGGELSNIELDLWFEIDANSIAFGKVFSLATSLNSDFSEIGIRCSYEVKDISKLWNDYNSFFPLNDKGCRDKNLSCFLDLAGNIKKHFFVRYFSLEKVMKGKKEVIESSEVESKEGKKIIHSLIKVNFLDAQRNIDDEGATRSNKLSDAFSSYYRRNLEQRDAAEEAMEVIEENNTNLTDHYENCFAPLMETIGGLGLPTENDKSMKIVSTLSPEVALKGGTDLFYFDGVSKHMLPETYNGLGFKNLIYMAIQIDNYYKQWLAIKEDRPLCQLIFIEEPEVHLHAQVQQTFISEIMKVLSSGAPNGEPLPQLALTTHSSHILDTVDFAKIRYFRRVAIGSEQYANTTINSLKTFQPNPLVEDGVKITEKEILKFLKKFLRLTHCDLFFADAAILVEGSAEVLLIAEMINKIRPELNKKYLTKLEVGGAYASRFSGLLEFLNIPYLVITDIDSVSPSDSRKNCRAQEAGAVTSNSSIVTFFDKKDISSLSKITDEDCEQVNGLRFVSFQQPVNIEFNGKDEAFYGRTLEESFVYENIELFQSKALDIGIDIPDVAEEIRIKVWERIKSSTFKKTEFAMDILSTDEAWNVPKYIERGLQWLSQKI